ncbi:hypothetical protein SAMN03159406_01152 [Rhizobium sp. NFR03]|nr:hypothetical protein SAMN03159406_01152 [Rhizobium sp. NFR03]
MLGLVPSICCTAGDLKGYGVCGATADARDKPEHDGGETGDRSEPPYDGEWQTFGTASANGVFTSPSSALSMCSGVNGGSWMAALTMRVT